MVEFEKPISALDKAPFQDAEVLTALHEFNSNYEKSQNMQLKKKRIRGFIMGTILFVCTIILIAMVLLVLFYFNTMNEEKTKVVDIRSDLEKEIASLKKELKNAQ